MKTLVLLFVLLVPLSAFSQDTISTYITSGCLNGFYSSGPPEYHFSRTADSIILQGNIEANCASSHIAIIQRTADTIFVTTKDTGHLATCSCYFNFRISMKATSEDSLVVFNDSLMNVNRMIQGIDSLNGVAQPINAENTWFEDGATWYYTTPYQFYLNEDFTKLEVVGDSLQNGIMCKAVRFTDYPEGKDVALELFMEQDKKIYYYNKHHNKFFLLYDFSAHVGDTVIVHAKRFKPTDGFRSHYDSIDGFAYKIVTIDSVKIGDYFYKRQFVHSLRNIDWTFEYDGIVENMGGLVYIFGRFGPMTGFENPGMLRCFSNSVISYKNPQWEHDCNYYVNIQEETIEDIKIKRQASSVEIFLSSKDGSRMVKMDVMDVNGKVIDTVVPNPDDASIILQHLCTGLYLLRITMSNGKTRSCKLVY